MNQRLANLLRLAFVVLDLLVLNLVFLVNWYIFSDNISPDSTKEYTYLSFFSNSIWVAVSWFVGIYLNRNIFSFEKFSRETVKAFVYFCVMEVLYLYLFKETAISRLFFVSVLCSFGISLLVNRFFHLGLYYFFESRNYIVKKVMIIGFNDRARKLAEYLEAAPIKTKIVGFCEEPANVTELSNYPIISGVRDAVSVSRAYEVTEIFSTIAPEQQDGIYDLMNEADNACIRFRIVPDLSHFIRKPVHINYFNDIPVLSLRKEPLDDVGNRIRKRLFDLAVSSLVILLILSWLVPIMAILIWLDSRGPIFFIQERSGVGGRPFKCIKFRSMKVNRDANARQATKGDARITRLGRFLRKSNLDEMPQFFNVLMSNMSVAGPRPHMIQHTDDYSKIVGNYMIRHFVKPGITGWAQVNGFRGEVREDEDIERRIEHDIWYLENWSLWLDTRIMFLTVLNMARGEKNAY
ncbi:MAG: undecaprenyl-phosphate glucose phosphotransferase [Chitinophagaceae bacterium]|nr:MAG: undecaprenyl-phosphate glucose phosphotransferase [Chitinophagaceae bacterium]